MYFFYVIKPLLIVIFIIFFLVGGSFKVFADDLFSSLASLRKLVGIDKGYKVRRSVRTKQQNKLDYIINKISRNTGVEKAMIKSIIAAESNFQQFAISHKGARGYMQLMSKTALALGVRNIYDPVENINAGSTYYRMMLDRFGGNRIKALYAYNAGPTAVEKGRIPNQTLRYAKKVMRHYRNFKRMEM